MTRTAPDWEAIEREYRAGQYSIAEIAAIHRLSRAAIQKRAKAKGWKRDLAERVRKAIAEKLVAPEVAPEVAATNDAATVEMAAERGAAVGRLHQKRAARMLATVDAINAKLEAAIEENELPVTMLAQTANSLASANDRLTAIERKAHNMDSAPDGGGDGLTVEIVRFSEDEK